MKRASGCRPSCVSFLFCAIIALTLLSAAPMAQAPAVTGDQKTLVIVANFTDQAVACSVDSVRKIMFDPSLSVAALFRDNSAGKLALSGDVVGPYTINQPSTDPCSLTSLGLAAEESAKAAGIDASSYPRRVYVMPPNSCGGSASSTIGGVPSYSWIYTCDMEGVYAHSLGHNLGLNHSGTSAPLPETEFNDSQDPMGWTNHQFPGLNAPHRYQLGWLGANNAVTVNQDGNFDIAPLGLDPALASAPQVLMIAKPDTQEYYYLSYRRQIGFDKYIGGGVFDRLSIHRYKAGFAERTYLLAGLDDGQSFVDPLNGITVSQLNHDSTRVAVSVRFTSGSCVAGAPTMTVAPQVQSGAAGSSMSYAVSVKNSDGLTCAPTAFSLNAAVPSGWTGTLSAASVTLAPGTSGQATLLLTSATGATAGTYNASVAAQDSSNAIHSVSAGLTYGVLDTVPPSPPSNLKAAASKSRKQVQLSWAAAADNVGIVGYRVWRNGAVAATSKTTGWVDSVWVPGAIYSYTVDAYDSAGNRSAASNLVTVSLPGGGK